MTHAPADLAPGPSLPPPVARGEDGGSVAVNRRIAALERTITVYKGLVEVSALMGAITDFDELLTAILEVARRVMAAQGSALILHNEATRQLEIVVARTGDGLTSVAKQVIPSGRGIAGWVFDHARSLLVPDAYADARFYREMDAKSGFRTRSILASPLLRDGKPVGVLEVINCEQPDKTAFDQTDLEAFEAYANLASTAIEKLRYLDEERHRARFEQELSIATEIQQNFLPRTLPQRDDVEFAAHYRPAREVGGDFYDIYETGPDEIYFVIGDVAGKGVPAALLMAQSLSSLRLLIVPGVAPVAAMARWNETLGRQALRGLFVTATLGRLTPSRRVVELASAGHCPPLLVRGAGHASGEERVEEVVLGRAPPLAVVSHAVCPANFLQLAPADTLVFFTDGLTDSRSPSANPGGGCLGVEGARAMLLKKPIGSATEIVKTLSEGEAAYRGEAAPPDDLTLLAFGFR
ncbi:MAG: SpoIIE family protein phosphatase [Verrucomicrobia bacterium]|nr:SpoIIE family protein phosphatase [Verrucomicrobiota bacterium]